MASDPENDPISKIALDKTALNSSLRTIAIWIVGFLLASWVFQSNQNFIFLLLLSWLFAIAMEPAVSALARKGWKRGLATGLVLFGVIAFAIAFITLFGSVLFSQAASLVSAFPNLVTDIVDWLNKTFTLNLDPKTIIDQLNVTPGQIANWAGSFAGGIVGVVTALVGGLFQLLTFMLFAFYFAADGPKIRRLIASWLKPSSQKVVVTTWDIAVAKTGGFVVSKVFLALVSATAHSLFFAAIGIPYWLPMGLITGITSQFIPTIGTYLGILIPTLFALFNDPMDAFYIVIFAGIYQQVENYLLAPRVSRLTMNIHPAIAFGSVILFANLFGAVGAIISVPLAAALVAVIDTYGKRYELIPELAEIERSETATE